MINQLASLIAIVDSSGVSRAAKKLLLTQPALTQHIRFLEQHFEKKLLTRKGNSMQLTPEGETLYALAKQLLAHYQKVENTFLAENTLQHPLRFSSVDSTMELIVPQALKMLLKNHENIQVESKILASADAAQEVLSEKIDLAICTLDHLSPELSAEKLYKEPLIFIGSKKHAHIKRRRQLEKEDFIIFPRHALTRWQIDNVFQELNICPNIVMENIKCSAIVSLIEAGLGVSIVPYYSVRADIDAGRIYKIPIKTKIARTTCIAYKKAHALPSIALDFINNLRKTAKQFA